MEHSVQSYIKSLPTDKIIEFIKQYNQGKLFDDFDYIIPELEKEINNRNNNKD